MVENLRNSMMSFNFRWTLKDTLTTASIATVLAWGLVSQKLGEVPPRIWVFSLGLIFVAGWGLTATRSYYSVAKLSILGCLLAVAVSLLSYFGVGIYSTFVLEKQQSDDGVLFFEEGLFVELLVLPIYFACNLALTVFVCAVFSVLAKWGVMRINQRCSNINKA